MNLFPIPVGNYKFRPITDIEHQAIRRELDNMMPNISNGITKNFNVLDSADLLSLKQDLTDTINDYFHEVYKPNEDFRLNITNSWCNVTRYGEQHHSHVHFNSILSAVLYLHVRGDDSIVFHRKDMDLLIRTYPIEETPYNQWHNTVPVTDNDLLMFPSSLTHRVARLNRSGMRISLSFNTFFSGYAGSLETLSEIRL